MHVSLSLLFPEQLLAPTHGQRAVMDDDDDESLMMMMMMTMMMMTMMTAAPQATMSLIHALFSILGQAIWAASCPCQAEAG
eukprot:5204296-Amphidinium_carterae.1